MDYLNEADQGRLEILKKSRPFVAVVLSQCNRIRASRTFARVQQKALDSLSFIVAKTLLGCEAEIKETTIAIHAHGEQADYNPAESSKIRVAAAALRKKLASYYMGE